MRIETTAINIYSLGGNADRYLPFAYKAMAEDLENMQKDGKIYFRANPIIY